jgi:uncharacterized membrane protein SirB2
LDITKLLPELPDVLLLMPGLIAFLIVGRKLEMAQAKARRSGAGLRRGSA